MTFAAPTSPDPSSPSPTPRSPSPAPAIPTVIQPTRRNLFVRLYGPLVRARTWKESVALLLGLPFGTAWFVVLVTGLSVSAGLFVTVVGLPLMVLTVAFGRVIGAVERTKVRALLGEDLPGFGPQRIPSGLGFWRRMFRRLGDSVAWRGVVYGFLAFPLGIAWFVTAVTLWAVSFVGIGFWIYAPLIPENSTVVHTGSRTTTSSPDGGASATDSG